MSNGLAIDVSPHQPGTSPDMDIIMAHVDVQNSLLRNNEGEDGILDGGFYCRDFEGFRGLLLDKGYQGLL